MDIGTFVSRLGERTQQSERSEAAQEHEGTGSRQLASGEHAVRLDYVFSRPIIDGGDYDGDGELDVFESFDPFVCTITVTE